jgi:hypothetical protein
VTGVNQFAGGPSSRSYGHKMHAFLSGRNADTDDGQQTRSRYPIKPLFGNIRTTNTVKEILYSEKSFIRTSVTKQSDRKIGAYYRVEC